MDALTLFGHIIAFIYGVAIGAAIMYFGGLIIDRQTEGDDES